MPDHTERFTQRSGDVMRLSQAEAIRLHHRWIGTEHLLVGLIQEQDGSDRSAAQVLRVAGLDVQQVQAQVEQVMPPGKQPSPDPGIAELTPDLQKTLQLAVDEARRLGQTEIDPEYLLLALLRQNNIPSSRVLQRLKVDQNELKRQVLQLLQQRTVPEIVANNSVDGAKIDSRESAQSSNVPRGIAMRVSQKDAEAHTAYYEAYPTMLSQLRALFRGIREQGSGPDEASS